MGMSLRKSDSDWFYDRLSVLRQAARTVIDTLQKDISFSARRGNGEKTRREKALVELIELIEDYLQGELDYDKYSANLFRKVEKCLQRVNIHSDSDTRLIIGYLKEMLEPDRNPPYRFKEELIQFFQYFQHLVDRAYYYQKHHAEDLD